MGAKPLWAQVLDDEALTRGLGDPEAKVLVEWLVDHAEKLDQQAGIQGQAGLEIKRLCRRGRAIGRFVTLWCHEDQRGAASQLAAAESFTWPLPVSWIDPCELMEYIVDWENLEPAISLEL
jgi:hypothetical protein